MKKAGLTDAVGLVEGLYAGAAPPGSGTSRRARRSTAPRIGEVYTKGTLTLARLGREAPIAAGNPAVRRCETSSEEASRRGCSTPRSARRGPRPLPRSPVIGTDAPEQYEQRDDIGAPRKRLPSRTA